MTSAPTNNTPRPALTPLRSTKFAWRSLAFVFVVALAARAGWGLVRPVHAANEVGLEFPDEQQYWSMAKAFRAGQGLPDELGFQATRMPLYPAFLSLFAGHADGVQAARAAQWVIGAMGAMFAAGLAGTLFGRRAGLLAGLLVALDPFLIFFSSLLLTETAFVTALVGLWWIAVALIQREGRSLAHWAALGLAAAGTVYIRESSLGLGAILILIVAITTGYARRAVLGGAIATAIIVLALVPWAARNERVVGDWCWLTTRGGISLYDGVGPQATGASNLGDIKQMADVESLDEVAWNRYFLARSLEAISSDPVRILKLALVKMKRMWNPFPNVDTYQSRRTRLISVTWTVSTFALAALGAVLLPIVRRREGWQWAVYLMLPALYLSFVHSLFIGSVRYRLGALPMLDALAAFAILTVVRRVLGRRRPHPSAAQRHAANR